MNALKKAALGALALATTGSAYSQTEINFAASNGDRNATQTAIGKLLGNDWKYVGTSGTVSNVAGTLTGSAGIYTGSNFGTFYGTYSGQPVIIRTNYAGALAGIAAVSGDIPQRFDRSTGSEPNGTTEASRVPNPIQATNTADYITRSVHFGFSTNFQSTSPFLGPYKGVTYAPVNEHTVGVSSLGFYASPGFPVDNITTQQAQLLYTSGVLPLAQFTGDWVNDKNKTVWAIGRNTDAGQRYSAYAEVGLGTAQVVRVWQPTISGAIPETGDGAHGIAGIGAIGGTVTSHALWPAETISGIFSTAGNGGYNSGANLAAVLTVTLGPNAYKGRYYDDDLEDFDFLFPDATAGYYIGYVTPGDANARVLGVDANGNTIQVGTRPEGTRGVKLKYNGVEHNATNTRNGQYTAWLYNRLITPQGGWNYTTPSGLVQTFAYTLRDQIRTVDAPAGGGIFDDGDFKVRRVADGGLVFEK